MLRTGIIAKYHVRVMLLFVMEAKEFSVTQRDLYFTRAEKSNLQSAFVTIFSVKSMKKEMIDNFK